MRIAMNRSICERFSRETLMCEIFNDRDDIVHVSTDI